MNPVELIDKYYSDSPVLREILVNHSNQVAQLCLNIVDKHPELHLDRTFVYEAAMLHDIGIFLTDAPGISCFGTENYIRHGILGGQILRREGFPRHARVAERHTGTGLTIDAIKSQDLPVPLQDWSPESMEEILICYADKFFSKSGTGTQKSYDRVEKSLQKFGEESILRLRKWHNIFS